MPAESHISSICAKCGGQIQPAADACPWCHAPAESPDRPQRIRVRKKRGVLKTYFEHVHRHWIYFLLAIVAAIAAAWFLLDFAQRSSSPSAPASLTLISFLTSDF